MNPRAVCALAIALAIGDARGDELGRLRISEDFAHEPAVANGAIGKLQSGWRFFSGKWEFADGAMTGGERDTDHRSAQAACVFPFKDAIFEFEVKLAGCRQVQFRIQDAIPEHICRVFIRRDGFSLQKDDHDHTGPDEAVPLGKTALAIKDGEWKKVRLEIRGEKVSATMDGRTITGTHSLIAAPKHFFEFIVTGASASFRQLRVWDAAEP